MLRQRNSRGTFKPHVSLRFRDNAGDLRTFSIDTTRTPGKHLQPDAYLITHAHSDHHGKSAMLSPNAVCSEKTAMALEIRQGHSIAATAGGTKSRRGNDRKFAGSMFRLGNEIDIEGTKVKTFPTEHTAGARLFRNSHRPAKQQQSFQGISFEIRSGRIDPCRTGYGAGQNRCTFCTDPQSAYCRREQGARFRCESCG